MCFMMVQCMVKENLNVAYKIFREHPHNNSLGGSLSNVGCFIIIVGERWLFPHGILVGFSKIVVA